VVVDATRDRLLVADRVAATVFAVNLQTGARSVLSSNTTTGGVLLIEPVTLALDDARNRALVVDSGLAGVVAVDLTTGGRTMLSGPSVPDGVTPFSSPYGIVLDGGANRALVADSASVVTVSIDTGARSVLTTAGNTGTWLPMGLGFDAATRTIVTGDLVIGALHVIDPSSGARSLASNDTWLRANDPLKPRGVAVDGARRIAWVTHDEIPIVQIVDLVTGERVYLTR
jgi:DNA-binding beta-propeller fold protein YncE